MTKTLIDVHAQRVDTRDPANAGVGPRDYTVLIFDPDGDGLDCWSAYPVEADTVGEAVAAAGEAWKRDACEGYPGALADPHQPVEEPQIFKVYAGKLGVRFDFPWR